MDKRLTIGELAKRSGTTTKTIRYYERIGLLLPDKWGDNGYRYYDESQAQQLRFIRRAQRLGLTVTEIGELMDLACEVKCNELRSALKDLFARKIRDYELKIAALKMLKRNLQPEENSYACQAFMPDCACLPSH